MAAQQIWGLPAGHGSSFHHTRPRAAFVSEGEKMSGSLKPGTFLPLCHGAGKRPLSPQWRLPTKPPGPQLRLPVEQELLLMC